jgi:hypothetical protein
MSMRLLYHCFLWATPFIMLGAQSSAALRITTLSPGPGVELVPTSALAVSKGGVVVVAQPSDHRFLMLRHGEAVRSVGRRGSGPGEFQMLSQAGWVEDTIWVSGQSQLSYFAPDGAFLRHGRIPQAFRLVQAGTTTRLLLHGLYAVRSNGDALMAGQASGGSIVAGWVTADGEMRAPLVTTPPVDCTSGSGIQLPFCNKPIVAGAPDGSRVVSATLLSRRAGTLRVELVAVESGGRTAYRTAVDIPEVPITRNIADSVKNEIANYRGTPPDLAARVRAAKMAEHFPPVDHLIVGRDGGVWLRVRVAPNRYSFRRFDRLGKYLGEADAPTTFRLMAADGATGWGILRDEDDIPSVAKVSWAPRP